MNARIFGLGLIACVAVTGMLLWGSSIPLGAPGEWVWPRLPTTPETIFGFGSALLAGLLYVAFVAWGARVIDKNGPIVVAARLVSLAIAAFIWLGALQQSVPAPADLEKDPYVLFYPRSSGYYWQARHDEKDTGAFLAQYEDLLAEQDYLHIGTHPPGLILGYRGLLAICDSSPKLCRAVLATCPHSASQAFQSITTLSAHSGQAVTRADCAAIWLAALITLLAAASTTIAIFVLMTRHFDRSTAWMIAGLWPLVPAIAVFHPKSDTLYPLFAVAAAAFWMTANDRRSPVRALLAGFVLWMGMLLSLAFVTVGLLMAVMTLWEWRRPSGKDESSEGTESAFRAGSSSGTVTSPASTARQRIVLLISGAVGFLLPTFGMKVWFDINLFNVWRWNLANHALFYAHNTRTWGKWLVRNPLELALSIGLPICCAVGVSWWRLIRSGEFRSARAATGIAILTVWGLLWISGKNMGEGARLWILLMPWFVMSAGTALNPTGLAANRSALPERPSSDFWFLSPGLLVLLFQMVACVLTVLRIDGFHFTELMQ